MKDVSVYPVILRHLSYGGYAVTVPDLDQFTQGKDLADTIYMARDLIGTMYLCCSDDGSEMPEPFSAEYNLDPGEEKVLVDIKLKEYRAKHENRLVKKNCTIPYYLEAAAEKSGLNFSRVLSEALAERLGLPLNV